MAFVEGFSKTATDWKAKAGNAIAAYQKPVTALAATHYLYSRAKERLDKKRGMKKTAIHNSFVDETDAGDNAKGNPSIETELSARAAWKRKQRGLTVALKETPVDGKKSD